MLNLPFNKLQIWGKGMNLVNLVYEMSKSFPKEERYGLISQIRRSAVSVPSNIAEGSQRKSNKEFANFILISKGSLAELQTQLIISLKQQYIKESDLKLVMDEIIELDKMLFAFHKKLTTYN